MNTIYRVVWNAATSKWVVVSELARGRKKRSSGAGDVVGGAFAARPASGKNNPVMLPKGWSAGAAGLIFLTLGATISGQVHAQVYVNDGVDGSCAMIQDVGTNGKIVDAVTSGNCNTDFSTQTDHSTFFGSGGGGGKGSNSLSLGGYLYVNSEGSVIQGLSLANKKLTSLAAGTAPTDAVNFKQLSDATAFFKANDYSSSGNSTANGSGAIAIGAGAVAGKASGTTDSIAIGLLSKAEGNQAVALGRLASSDGLHAAAFADSAKANAEDSLASGYSASVDATSKGGVALGAGASVGANATNSIALGYGSTVSSANTVSIGNDTLSRKLTGLADGTISADSRDAVNGKQLFNFQSQLTNGELGLVQQNATSKDITVASSAGGGLINFSGTAGGRVLTGIANGTNDSDAVTIAQLKAVGLTDPNGKPIAAVTYDDFSLASARLGGSMGTVLRNLSPGMIAAGSMDAINGGQLFALQEQVRSINDHVNIIQQGIDNGTIGGGTLPGTGDNSTSSGANAVASGAGSTANGSNSSATGDNSTASGANAVASGTSATASGAGAQATGSNSTAMGANATASGSNSVALGSGSVADRDNSVSVGSAGNERQITNVAAGTQRTDAANWGQVQDAVQGVQDWANRKFEHIENRMNGLGAMTAAYSQMALSAQGVDKVNRIGVGVGTQGGQAAIAVGYSHQLASNLNVSFGGSASGRDTSVGAGVAFGW